MNKPTILVLIAFFSFFLVNAQMSDSTALVVHKDNRIEVLLKKQANINKTAIYKTNGGQYKGYRVMVLSTNDKELAYRTKGSLLGRYPDSRIYMSYQTPFYKLKMGDFLKRGDAEDLRKELSVMFPRGVFIVSDIIQLTPDEEKKLLGGDDENN
jgi:hypothetical protein